MTLSWQVARLAVLLIAAMSSYPSSAQGRVTSFSDISYWIGQGEQRAALAIDWDGAMSDDTALVWGYRWDGGDVTGEDLIRAVVTADTRLVAKLGTVGSGLGLAVIGLGYDQNNDGFLGLDDGTEFPPDGIVLTGPSDDAEPLDTADTYREGWESGYWHYGVGTSVDGQLNWATSGLGPTSRQVTDGDWHSLAFAMTLRFDEFAQSLLAAELPTLPGDFNGSGRVDAADYTVWRDGLAPEGRFTPGDYADWATAYGQVAPSFAAPEPSAGSLLLLCCYGLNLIRNRTDQ